MAGSVSVKKLACLPNTQLGESPVWEEELGALLYVDVLAGSIHRYYPASGRHQTVKVAPTATGANLSMAVPVEGRPDLLLVSVARDLGLIQWRESDPDESSTTLNIVATVDQDKPHNAFNDGKCDSQGRLWIGTYGNVSPQGTVEPPVGSLYCFSSDLKPRHVLKNLYLPNGLTWSNDMKKFYLVDSAAFNITVYDFDEKTGTLEGGQVLLQYKSRSLQQEFPDGLTTDTNGNLWVANMIGARVVCLDPGTGAALRTVTTPVDRPTCAAWGGPEYATLYVTTTTLHMTAEQIAQQPDSGALYEVTGLGCKGTPHYRARVDQDVIRRFYKD